MACKGCSPAKPLLVLFLPSSISPSTFPCTFLPWHTFWVINVKVFVAVYAFAVLSGVAFIINFMQKVSVLLLFFRECFYLLYFCICWLAGREAGRQHHLQTTNSLAHQTGHMAGGRSIVAIVPLLLPPPGLMLVPLAHFPNASIHPVSLSLQYNYLMQFDYLPKSDLETGALRTEKQLIDAIRSLQVRAILGCWLLAASCRLLAAA